MSGFKDTALILSKRNLKHGKPVEERFASLRSWSKVAPLLASLIAPITSLLDIPALTVCSTILNFPEVHAHAFFGWQQHWYTKDGAEQPDFTASLVLSAIGLAFNLLANALIVMRFSANASYWKLATQLSLVCWIVKVSFMHLQYVWM